MARVIAAIVRHGDYHQRHQTPSAHQPFALTERGTIQAQAAAQSIRVMLEQTGWNLYNAMDCSRLQRAWQTAEIMRTELSDCFLQPANLLQTDSLAERGLGSAANLSVAEIEAILAQDPRYSSPPADWKSNSHYCLPLMGAESLMQAGERVAYHLRCRLQQLAAEVIDDTLQVFVGHGAAFRHAAHLLGVLQFEQIAALSMHHGEPIYLEYHPGGDWTQVGGYWKVRSAETGYTD